MWRLPFPEGFCWDCHEPSTAGLGGHTDLALLSSQQLSPTPVPTTWEELRKHEKRNMLLIKSLGSHYHLACSHSGNTVWFQIRKAVACSGHSHCHHPQTGQHTSAGFLKFPAKPLQRSLFSQSTWSSECDKEHLTTLDKATTAGGAREVLGGSSREWPWGMRCSQDKNFSLTGCGWTWSLLQQWPQMMTGTLMSSAGSTHFLSITTQADKSFPSKGCIKTQWDHRRCFTPRNLFQAAKEAQ